MAADNFLREWRLYRALTMHDVAGRVLTSVANLSLVERGERPPTAALLRALSDIYQCPAGHLLDMSPSTLAAGNIRLVSSRDPDDAP